MLVVEVPSNTSIHDLTHSDLVQGSEDPAMFIGARLRRGAKRSRRAAGLDVRLMILLLGAAVVLSACYAKSSSRQSDSDGRGGGSASDPCVAPAGASQQDVDPKDSAETPWKRPSGEPLTVYFENRGLSDRYWDLVRKAVEIWSRSPCVRAVAVAECPPGVNCVGVREKKRAAFSPSTDGEFSGKDSGKYRRGGTVTIYTKLMNKATDNGALATIVHEIGHALGLVHRKNKHDVMNANTDGNTDPNPDDVDFANLAAIYGARR
jgi:hypothetical protein